MPGSSFISNENSAVPADPRRVAHQMANAAAVAEKLICSEMVYFTDDSAGPRAKNLREFLQQTNACLR